ncbi:10172_t:CDS:2, partial [Acaulospora colombiana]
HRPQSPRVSFPHIHTLAILPTPNDATMNPINSRLRLQFDEVVEFASLSEWAVAREEQGSMSGEAHQNSFKILLEDAGYPPSSAYFYKLRAVAIHTKVPVQLGYSSVRSETQSFHYSILLKINLDSPSLVDRFGSLSISGDASSRIETEIAYMKPLEGSLYTTEIIKFGVYRGMLWSVTMLPTSLLLLEPPPRGAPREQDRLVAWSTGSSRTTR